MYHFTGVFSTVNIGVVCAGFVSSTTSTLDSPSFSFSPSPRLNQRRTNCCRRATPNLIRHPCCASFVVANTAVIMVQSERGWYTNNELGSWWMRVLEKFVVNSLPCIMFKGVVTSRSRILYYKESDSVAESSSFIINRVCKMCCKRVGAVVLSLTTSVSSLVGSGESVPRAINDVILAIF